jgi:hypothetical protein
MKDREEIIEWKLEKLMGQGVELFSLKSPAFSIVFIIKPRSATPLCLVS